MAVPPSPLVAPAPYAPPSWGGGDPVMGWAGLSGLSQGLASGLQSAMQISALRNYRDAMLGYRQDLLAQRAPVAEANAQRAQAEADRIRLLSGAQPPAGSVAPQGTQWVQGKGFTNIPKQPGLTAGGNSTLNARYKVADSFLDQFGGLMDKVPGADNAAEATGKGYFERIWGHIDPSSPAGQVQNFITTSAPSVVSAISNRANQTEINQLQMGLRQIMNMSNDKRPEAINRVRTMLHSIIDANPPSGATPQGASGAAGWKGGNVHVYPDGTQAVWNGSTWTKQ